MSKLTPEIAAKVTAACQANSDALAQTLTAVLKTSELQIETGEAEPFDRDRHLPGMAEAGLLFAVSSHDDAALVLLPNQQEWLPDDVLQSGTETRAQLDSLAGNLGELLLSETVSVTAARGRVEPQLAEAVARLTVAEDAVWLPLKVTADSTTVDIAMCWPVRDVHTLWEADPDVGAANEQANAEAANDEQAENEQAENEQANAEAAVADGGEHATTDSDTGPAARATQADQQAEAAGAGGAASSTARSTASADPMRRALEYKDVEDGIRLLPNYSRSLLRIRVPVSVTLAAKSISVEKVLELGPGSIIQFKKPCDDPLTLCVGGQEVARGEAVKVGDKFGLWITSMTLPEERFWVITGQHARQRVK